MDKTASINQDSCFSTVQWAVPLLVIQCQNTQDLSRAICRR